MDMNRDRLLKQVMAADFSCYDLALYLNTHPCDQKALALYNYNVQQAKILRDTFERMYGPLTAHAASSNCNRWQWIDEPWPWEHQ